MTNSYLKLSVILKLAFNFWFLGRSFWLKIPSVKSIGESSCYTSLKICGSCSIPERFDLFNWYKYRTQTSLAFAFWESSIYNPHSVYQPEASPCPAQQESNGNFDVLTLARSWITPFLARRTGLIFPRVGRKERPGLVAPLFTEKRPKTKWWTVFRNPFQLLIHPGVSEYNDAAIASKAAAVSASR